MLYILIRLWFLLLRVLLQEHRPGPHLSSRTVTVPAPLMPPTNPSSTCRAWSMHPGPSCLARPHGQQGGALTKLQKRLASILAHPGLGQHLPACPMQLLQWGGMG